MFRRVCVSLCLMSLSLVGAAPRRAIVKDRPYLWPQPNYTSPISTNPTTVFINPSNFIIQFSDNFPVGTHMTGAADNRFRLFSFPHVTNGYMPEGVSSLGVTVDIQEDTTVLDYEPDESYTLEVTVDGKINIDAVTVFGALYGLTTLSQLIEYSSTPQPHYYIPYAPITIEDGPRFPIRGLMIDTSQHYLSTTTIQRIIIAMHLNKLNVLHWHIGDAYSWPLQSTVYPKMTEAGAFDPTAAVYTPDDIHNLITFGHDRGVRIVPEFEMFGHMTAMLQFNQSLAACPGWLSSNDPRVSLDPTTNDTYDFLYNFLYEQNLQFTSDTVHFGGNDMKAVIQCYQTNTNIVNWVAQNNMTINDLPRYFWSRFFDKVWTSLIWAPILWADEDWTYDPVAFNVTATGLTYQVLSSQELLRNITLAGYNATLSAGWVLNRDAETNHIPTWEEMYEIDPHNSSYLENSSYTKNVRGGEVILWGEEASDFTIDTLLWPRASAVAERLWSPEDTELDDTTQYRLDAQACRMSRRRIRAAPSIPGFCSFANDYVPPSFPQVGLSYAAFYTLIGLSVVGGLYILAIIVKQIAVVRAASAKKHQVHLQEEREALLMP